MNTRTLAGLLLVLPLAAGCASRTAPFNDMDKAQITVLRLQGQEPPPAATPATPGATPGAFPGIPGLPPEWQNAANQAAQGLQQMIPPGILPPGLIPGANPGANPANPAPQAQAPRFEGFIIVAQMPLTDDKTKNDLLDVFGHESSFNTNRGNCFVPGFGVSMQRPNQPPVDLLVSFQCNQAMGNGFRWPYQANGFTPDTRDKLQKIYEKLFGPLPPSGA